MIQVDVNGNTIKELKRLNLGGPRIAGTYQTDSAGRIMVDRTDGGYVVFFAEDDPDKDQE